MYSTGKGQPYSAHGMRNEMHFRLNELHRLVQCSRFLLARDQKYLCLMEAGESGKMLSSQITDELKLVAHPVGRSTFQGNYQLLLSLKRPFLAGALVALDRRVSRPETHGAARAQKEVPAVVV